MLRWYRPPSNGVLGGPEIVALYTRMFSVGDRVQPGGGEDLKGFKSLFMRLRRMGGSWEADDMLVGVFFKGF